MSNKQHLKPLNHKKFVNNIEPVGRTPLAKDPNKVQNKNIPTPKPTLAKKSSNGQSIKPVKYQRSTEKSTKIIEHYDCDDFDFEIEDNNYFESQLQKNIKTEIMSKTGKPQAKGQIVLPKLESDMKVRGMKELEKEIDIQMSKMMDQLN